MWRWWTCRRLRARLVDVASGSVTGAERREVESHLATCTACSEALAALREVPPLVRVPAGSLPAEEFWQGQRRAIMQAIQGVPAPAAAPRSPSRDVTGRPRWLTWAPALAAATAVLAVVALRPAVPWRAQPMVPAADVDGLDDPTLLSLSDLAGVSAPDVEHSVEVVRDEAVLPELSNDELDALAQLVGVRGR